MKRTIGRRTLILNPCVKEHKVEVLQSSAGYYIGTLDEEGCPYCRITPYYSNEDIAQKDLDNYMNNNIPFVVREASELAFCGCKVGGKYVNGWDREVL